MVPHFPVQFQVGVHPQTFDTPPPAHVCGSEHAPQLTGFPQPSSTVPQFNPAHGALAGVQPQTPGVPPPPHLWPVPLHVPQSSVLPQLSGSGPQFFPAAAHVVGVQPHTPVVPLPPHV